MNESKNPNPRSKSEERSDAGSGECERIFKSALDLFEERGRQVSKPFDNPALIDGFHLLSHSLGSERKMGHPLGNERMTRREVGGVLGQWNNDYELAVLIDAIVGENNNRPALFDLDADGGVKVSDYDITPPYGDHLIPPSQGWPRPPRRSVPNQLIGPARLGLPGDESISALHQISGQRDADDFVFLSTLWHDWFSSFLRYVNKCIP